MLISVGLFGASFGISCVPVAFCVSAPCLSENFTFTVIDSPTVKFSIELLIDMLHEAWSVVPKFWFRGPEPVIISVFPSPSSAWTVHELISVESESLSDPTADTSNACSPEAFSSLGPLSTVGSWFGIVSLYMEVDLVAPATSVNSAYTWMLSPTLKPVSESVIVALHEAWSVPP